MTGSILVARVVFGKRVTLQRLESWVPTTDGRELPLVRRTKPDHDVALLLQRLERVLPRQAPQRGSVVATFGVRGPFTSDLQLPGSPVAEVG